MDQDSNLLSELSAALPELNKSETKVARAILEEPETLTARASPCCGGGWCANSASIVSQKIWCNRLS